MPDELAASHIRRLGKYVEVDERGYLEKVADASNIEGRWSGAVEAAKRAYLDRWGEALHSIYVRGSVANGCAIEGVSDLDCVGVFEEGEFDGSEVDAWATEAEKALETRFPFVSGFELTCAPIGNVLIANSPDAFVVKVEGACVHGEDLAGRIGRYKPGPGMALQARYFRRFLGVFVSEYPREVGPEQQETLAWIMRRFLRLGMELVMEEEQRYTRDLYLCYESFAKHYPRKRDEMYRALGLAVNPEIGEQAEAFARDFGGWLAREADARLQKWDRDSAG